MQVYLWFLIVEFSTQLCWIILSNITGRVLRCGISFCVRRKQHGRRKTGKSIVDFEDGSMVAIECNLSAEAGQKIVEDSPIVMVTGEEPSEHLCIILTF